MILIDGVRCKQIMAHMQGKQCTAREIADHFEWSIDTTGNYLTALVRARKIIITREETEARNSRRTYYVFATPGEAPEYVPVRRGRKVRRNETEKRIERAAEKHAVDPSRIAGPCYRRGMVWGRRAAL